WGSLAVGGALGVGAVLVAMFVVVEARVAGPLMPLGFFRSRRRIVGNAVLFTYSAAMAVLFFSMALYLQQVRHFSALSTGLSFLPIGPMFMLAGGLNSRLLGRIGMRAVMVTGLVLVTVAFLLFRQVHIGGSFVRDVLIGMLIFPVGAGFAVVS